MDPDELNTLGNDLSDAGRYAEAENAYRRAADAAPDWFAPWFNLGLMCKFSGRWQESLDYNQRALACDATFDGAWWNLGIAATALGNWTLARRAWEACGCPDGNGEVVWCDRLDPARALIRNVPTVASGFREGDIVLHDGEPKGTRQLNGETVSVFNALQLLERSPRNTFEARVRAEAQDDIDALENVGQASGVVIADWSRSIHNICKACSEGSAHEKHIYEEPPWDPQHRVGLSALSLEQASSVLMEWASAAPSREVMSIA